MKADARVARNSLPLLAFVLFSTTLRAADTPPTEEEIGLRIGTHAPAFTLKDQTGKQVSLDALLKKGPVALVFFRSAETCLACQLQLIKLQRHVKEINDAGGQLVGISADPASAAKCFADNEAISIPMLTDTGSKIIDAYGVRDTQRGPPGNGYARHIIFIVDQKGVIRDKRPGVIYDERTRMAAFVQALKDAKEKP